MSRPRTGEEAFIASDGIGRKRVRLGSVKHTIKLGQCTTLAQAKKRGDVLAIIAARMTAANTPEEVALVGLRKVGGADVKLSDDGAFQFVSELIGGWRPESTCPTVGAIARRWQSGELARTYPDDVEQRKESSTVYRVQKALDKYILPILEHVPVDMVEPYLDAVKAAVAHMPQSGSRRQALQPLKTIMDMCVHPIKTADGRPLIARTPIPEGWLPSAKRTRELQWLRPDEVHTLLACIAVPMWRRALWDFYIRNGPRENEALAMTLAQFDLGPSPSAELYKHQTKTKKRRFWSLNRTGAAEGLRRYVALMRPLAQPGDRMFVDGDGNPIDADSIDLPALLRADLRTAGITRPALFITDTTSRNIVVHDLRATCVTVRLAADWEPDDVMRVTGHIDRGEMDNYQREAESFADVHGVDFHPMHVAIPELAAMAPAAAAVTACVTAVDAPVGSPVIDAPAVHGAPGGTLSPVGHALATSSPKPHEYRAVPYSIVEYPDESQGIDMTQKPTSSHLAIAAQPRPAAMVGHQMADADVRLAALEGQVAVLLHLVERQPAALVAGLADTLAAQVTASVVAALTDRGVVQRPQPRAVPKPR